MILVTADVFVKDGCQDEFIECAKKCISATLKESGNISYDLNSNVLEETRFTFVEKWESSEALQLHMNTEHFKIFSNEVTVLLAKELEINVYDANKVN